MQHQQHHHHHHDLNPSSIIIVGAGVFGASTALHLSRRYPSYGITVFDRSPFPSPSAASTDISKIVRAAYSDLNYCRLAARSHDIWRNDRLLNKFYHEAGMLSIRPYKGGARAMLENFKRLGINEDAKVVTPEEVKTMFNGVFERANFNKVEEFLWEPNAGWAEAANALAAIMQAAVDNGVSYVSNAVSKLIVVEGRCCQGVELTDGSKHYASKVLLCAGADTARILAESAPQDPGLHAGPRFVAGAIIEAKVKLTSEQLERYKATPAVLWDADPARGETMPPTPDGYLKFIRDIPLANTLVHAASKTRISVAPPNAEGTEWTARENLPEVLQDEMTTVIGGIFGPDAAQELIPQHLRLCWEPLAPDESWFVTPHPRCENLYIATAGSGHAWKFLPVLGEFTVRMMLDPKGWEDDEFAKSWAWDRELIDSPDEDVIPRRQLADMR
ncbi:uncharacterized protein PV06_06437 [Exophiala oligosperma]|uniref:FAD dependent oxidoreductase domain-containing protein n=1 Tax=Exophiala oligosperma TaxID=215243 RepID=A0A0D2ASV5_9EURO|nr:uncharacterized protein PV06_06437 [Exophiala oligosperma]KIW42941.1 hypothetical protein PV06_06437 [Exophiala oligosperma]